MSLFNSLHALVVGVTGFADGFDGERLVGALSTGMPHTTHGTLSNQGSDSKVMDGSHIVCHARAREEESCLRRKFVRAFILFSSCSF